MSLNIYHYRIWTKSTRQSVARRLGFGNSCRGPESTLDCTAIGSWMTGWILKKRRMQPVVTFPNFMPSFINWHLALSRYNFRAGHGAMGCAQVGL